MRDLQFEVASTSTAGHVFAENLSESAIREYPEIPVKRDPLYIVIPITLIYASILLTGIVGNISTCIVIVRNKSMHTATNYYLFSLAISDLLLLVSGLPAEIYLVWSRYPYVFGEVFCVIRGFAAESSSYASVLTITAFTIERYVAICYPFLSHTMSKLSRAIKLIFVIWIVAFAFALPQALQFGIVPTSYGDVCVMKNVIFNHSFEFSTALFFIIPMTLITILYVLIGLKLRNSNLMKTRHGSVLAKHPSSDSTGDERHCRHQTRQSSRRVLKMLVAVVLAFFICWAPFHMQRLVAIYGTAQDNVSPSGPRITLIYDLVTYISGILYYVSASINPILYNIMSIKFRIAFMETLTRTWKVAGFPIKRKQRSYSSLFRSQHQRDTDAFGSKTVQTIGNAVVPESTECSGNSTSGENPKQRASVKHTLLESSNEKFSLPHHRTQNDSLHVKDNEPCQAINQCIYTHHGNVEKYRKYRRKFDDEKSESVDGSLLSTSYNASVVSTVISREQFNKKQWRLFRWYPRPKTYGFSQRPKYSSSGDLAYEPSNICEVDQR